MSVARNCTIAAGLVVMQWIKTEWVRHTRVCLGARQGWLRNPEKLIPGQKKWATQLPKSKIEAT